MESFEDALNELKTIIEKLESGNLSLEESLAAFERGTRLIASCHEKLNEVQRRVQILVESLEGDVIRKEFDLEE
ncbi:MAG TPA: exodeoxyribonuclease VII small subunit [Thermodesulfobacteriota bacterium]|nr:exodeoxyribonuclease VII small subunit [Thermodesulfobacteriota bacterium]